MPADDANVVFNVAQSHWHSGRIKQAVRDQRRNWPNLSPEHFANVTIPRLCKEFPEDTNMQSFYQSFADAVKGKL